MNVLSRGLVPNVVSLRQALREWLDHRKDVLVRRSKFRLAKIDHRLEALAGYLIVYLNIDKVIKIIREKDEPKPALMKAFKLKARCKLRRSSTCGYARCGNSRRWRSGASTIT